jgi:UDP-N-acetyl-D-galactosamine dehydrogenase
VEKEYGIRLTDASLFQLKGQFDAVILAVAHKEFRNFNIRDFLRDPHAGVVYDVKGVADRAQVDARL